MKSGSRSSSTSSSKVESSSDIYECLPARIGAANWAREHPSLIIIRIFEFRRKINIFRGRIRQGKGAASMAGEGVTPPGETPFLLVYICNLIAPCMPRILLRLPSIITYSLHRFSADKDDRVTDRVLPANDRRESFL